MQLVVLQMEVKCNASHLEEGENCMIFLIMLIVCKMIWNGVDVGNVMTFDLVINIHVYYQTGPNMMLPMC